MGERTGHTPGTRSGQYSSHRWLSGSSRNRASSVQPASNRLDWEGRTRRKEGRKKRKEERNGTEKKGGTARNRTERNGTEQNGTERNRTERNGTERNGIGQELW